MKVCPCGTGQLFDQCCGVFISKQKTPSTPEMLMRSRYTAYVLADVDYIAATMKSPAADGYDLEETRAWAKHVKWHGLEVIQTAYQGDRGTVEFIARYETDKQMRELHEISEFRLEAGVWYYTDSLHSCR